MCEGKEGRKEVNAGIMGASGGGVIRFILCVRESKKERCRQRDQVAVPVFLAAEASQINTASSLSYPLSLSHLYRCSASLSLCLIYAEGADEALQGPAGLSIIPLQRK